ncbi:MAG: hypothetical protein UU89_C0011G0004 [Parcubacteria group bacterium GW2011_GWC2_42_11]|nr:MAG: hypothetical protein UU89_C0011G0004 [Parcubacteria group bacterium GW2011_GWC2_42_11]
MGLAQTDAVRLVRHSSETSEGGGAQAKWNELYE